MFGRNSKIFKITYIILKITLNMFLLIQNQFC